VNVGDHPPLQFTDAVSQKNVDLASLNGKMVIVDFWASWCGPCMEEAPHIVQINQKYAAQGLQMIGVSLDSDQSAMMQIVKDKGFVWPQFFDGGGWQNRIAQAWGVDSIPQTFIISPQGEVLWRGHPAMVDDPLTKAMQEHPPQLVDPQTLAAANANLDKVEAAISSGKFADAIKLLGAFPPAARAEPAVAKRDDADIKQLNGAADTAMAQVDPLIEAKNYMQAVTQLKQLVNAMSGTDEGKKAQQKLNALRAEPAAAAAIAQAAREDSANFTLAIAQKLQAAKRDHQAYIAYKALVKEYPGTSAATTATAAIQAYDADPSFAAAEAKADAADRSSKAKSALSLAMNYLNAGRTDTAREKFQDIVAHYPGTPEAQSAKDELAQMGN
jgi:thiol-disulfide isomerase/thioredoxin